MTDRKFAIIDTHEEDGCLFELHKMIPLQTHPARIYVFDVDAGRIVGNTLFATIAQAQETFDAIKAGIMPKGTYAPIA